MFYNICPEVFCFELHITIKCCTVSDYQIEDDHLETDMHFVRSAVNHVDCYFKDLQVGCSQFPCDIACAAPQLLFNPLNAELNPVCHLLALLEAHHILHVSRIRVNSCSYGTFVWWYPCSLLVICFHR